MIRLLMMCVSVIVLLLVMVLGIVMGIREDSTPQAAHAHLKRVSGVLLFLFGLDRSSWLRAKVAWRKPRAGSILFIGALALWSSSRAARRSSPSQSCDR